MLIRKIRPRWTNLRWLNKDYCKITPQNLEIYKDHSSYSQVLSSYNNLDVDMKNEKGFITRMRRYGNYQIDIDRDVYSIYYTGKDTFEQNVPDQRKEKRKFTLLEPEIVDNPFFLHLMAQTCALSLLNSQQRIYSFDVSLHQVRQITYPDIESHNAPEGIHQDGVDYIVSAFVLKRYNIKGGESIIYDENKNQIDQIILKNGEGIFQNDKKLWHYVTPIQSKRDYVGYRDIIGLDITINP